MNNNIYEILERDFSKKNNKVALKEDGRLYTYNELIGHIDEVYSYLRQNGVGKGCRVAIYLPNNYTYIILLFACFKLGCIVIPINWINDNSNIKHIIEDSKAEFVFTVNKKMDNFHYIKVSEMNGYGDLVFGTLRNVIDQSANNETIALDVCLIIYTSGSTGMSKGVIITHYNLYMGTKIVADYLKMSSNDIILSILPFSFDYGMNQIMSSFYSSATVVIKYPYLFQELIATIDNDSITGLAGMTSIWLNMLSCKNIKNHSFQSLRYITNSGQAIPDKCLDELKNVFQNTDIYLMYGLTECFRCTYLEPKYYETKKGSIGKAIPQSEVYIVNDNGNVCRVDEVGELIFRGPTVAQGYLGQSDTKVFRPNPFNELNKENVVYSGDLVYKDSDDFIYFVGRRDKLIKKMGYRVNCDQISNILISNLSFIEECCVVGIKNEKTADADIIVFFKVKNEEQNDESVYCNQVMAYSKKMMPIYMRLSKTIVLNEIPKLNNTKYDMNALVKLYNDSDK